MWVHFNSEPGLAGENGACSDIGLFLSAVTSNRFVDTVGHSETSSTNKQESSFLLLQHLKVKRKIAISVLSMKYSLSFKYKSHSCNVSALVHEMFCEKRLRSNRTESSIVCMPINDVYRESVNCIWPSDCSLIKCCLKDSPLLFRFNTKRKNRF